MLGSAGIGGDKGQVDFSLHGSGELDLGAFGRVAQTLQRHFVALGPQVQAFVLLELVNQPVHDALINVVAAQVGISIGGLDLDDAFAHFQNGNVEGAAAKIVDRD